MVTVALICILGLLFIVQPKSSTNSVVNTIVLNEKEIISSQSDINIITKHQKSIKNTKTISENTITYDTELNETQL